MAIFQPTNIVPSTFAGVGGGVVDANANISVSWQVNGNSAMTQFVITVCENTEAGTVVHTETVSQSPAFYGTDARGNPVPYVYEPGVSWSTWGLSNGNSYKFKITQYWSVSEYVEMNTEAVFVTRAAPSVSISPDDERIYSIGQTFTGTYTQANGDALNWVRWTLTDIYGNVIEDTGEVYTQVLSFTYDRFFNGNDYVLTCAVETENGVQATDSVTFSVSYATPTNIGEITASCNPDDSVTLTWGAGVNAPGTADDGYGSVSGGLLSLNAGKSVTWDTVNGDSFSYDAPYLFAWRAVIGYRSFGSRGYGIPQQFNRKPDKTYPGTYAYAISGKSPAEMVWNNQADQQGTVSVQIAATTQKTLVSNTDQDTEGFSLYPRGENNARNYFWDIEWDAYLKPLSVAFSGDAHIIGYTVSIEDKTDSFGMPYWFVRVRVQRQYYAKLLLYKLKTTYEYYVGSATATPTEDGIKNEYLRYDDPQLRANGSPFAPEIKSTVTFDGTNFTVNGVAAQSGTYDVSVQYDHAYIGPLAYKGVYRGSLSVSLPYGGGEILSGYVTDCTAGFTAYLSADAGNTPANNHYTITFYGATDSIPTADATLVLNAPLVGADSYVFTNMLTLPDNVIAGTEQFTVTPTPSGGVTYEKTGDKTYRVTVKTDNLNGFSVSCSYRAVQQTAPTGNATIASSPYTDETLWESGGLYADSGEPTANARRIRTGFLAPSVSAVTPSNGYSFIVYAWEDGTYLGGWTGSSFSTVSNVPIWNESAVDLTQIGDYQYKIVAKNGSNTAVTTADAANISFDSAFSFGMEQASAFYPCDAVYTSGGTEAGRITLPKTAWSVVLAARVKDDGTVTYEAYPFDYTGAPLGTMTASGTAGDLPPSVSSVTLTGAQTADFVYLSTDASTDISSGSPIWDGNVRIYARFADGLGGGTTDEDDFISFAIYRADGEQISLVGTFPLTATSATDYGVRPGVPFSYTGYYVSSGSYSQGAESGELCLIFRQCTLIEAEEDATEANVYHPVRVFRFRNNIETGSYSNSNSPVLLDNFTRFPLRQPTAKNALSGVLSGLLGYFENGEYINDSVSLANAVSSLSTTANPLFLRDMKGHLLMVGTSGPITRTVNNMTRVLPTTISIPWTEIGDASAVSIVSVE